MAQKRKQKNPLKKNTLDIAFGKTKKSNFLMALEGKRWDSAPSPEKNYFLKFKFYNIVNESQLYRKDFVIRASPKKLWIKTGIPWSYNNIGKDKFLIYWNYDQAHRGLPKGIGVKTLLSNWLKTIGKMAMDKKKEYRQCPTTNFYSR